MSSAYSLPILKEVVPSGLSYAAHYVVEFDTDSLWYETSITLAAQALKSGVKVDYHTFQHSPGRVRESLARLGLKMEDFESNAAFRIMDTYSAATGAFRTPEKAKETGAGGPFWAGSVNLPDWSLGAVRDIKGEVPKASKKRLHIDDNTSLLLRYNGEDQIIDDLRTRVVPWAISLELTMIHALVVGVASDSFYKHVESMCEGIFDLRSREEHGQMEHYLRARTMRGGTHDSRWRSLRVSDSGEVILGRSLSKAQELGISGWLKGPRK